VLLAVGVLGVVAFFLPYVKLSVAGESKTYSALGVMTAKDLDDEFKKAKDAIAEDAASRTDDAESKESVATLSKNLEDAFDLAKGLVIVVFAPALAFLIIGGVGAARGKLERLGGGLALGVGLIGAAVNGVILAAFQSSKIKADGGGAEIGQFLLLAVCIMGMLLGVLTVLKPDRGGRFG
jgi:hypothetical protein